MTALLSVGLGGADGISSIHKSQVVDTDWREGRLDVFQVISPHTEQSIAEVASVGPVEAFRAPRRVARAALRCIEVRNH